MTSRTRLGTAALAATAVAALAAGTAAAQPGAGVDIAISDKGFPESQLVTEAYRQALEAQGFSVSTRSLESTQVALSALKEGQIDIYPDYDGTIWGTVLKRSPKAAPKNRARFFASLRTALSRQGITALNPAQFSNDNQVACTKAAIRKYRITNLTRLGRVSRNLVYSANPEHLGRADGLPLLRRSYGVNFKSVRTVDISLRYKPIEDNQADCVYAFGTDPQLGQLANKISLIRDNKGLFVGLPYRTFPMVNSEFLSGLKPEARTALVTTLNKVNARLTQATIARLNFQVIIQKDDAEDVAEDFLKANRLI